MKGDEAFLEMLRDAVTTLRSTGRALEDVLDGCAPNTRSPRVAHALGILEGAGVTLGLTRLELLDAHDLL